MNARKEAERQLAFLERGVEEIVPREEMLQRLQRSIESGKPLRVKLGIDPTTKNVHLGHMVPYGKLKAFQELGHQAVLIIGDYTASIGDPSGRNAERPPLGLEEARRNAETYADQIFRLVDRERAEIRYQSEWFASLSLAETLRLAGAFSLAQILAHETFRLRYEAGTRVGLHELLYPLLQAYDSVMVGADVELGGTDQKFNILAGRDLQKDRGMNAQCAILVRLLPGLDGKKMSKSLGNDIPVACGADEQFARLMALADEHIETYQELVLFASAEEREATRGRLESGENPMDIKLDLASRIVDRFNGIGSGVGAREEWMRRFSRKERPRDIAVHVLAEPADVCAVLRDAGLVSSKSEARRLIAEGAVRLDETRITQPDHRIDPAALGLDSGVLRIGTRRYVKLVPGTAP